jgi:ABC-type antimicrobial peptide transport system permease subunit
MALGANRGDVVRMVIAGAFSQLVIGLLIGVPLALLAGRALAHQLYEVGRLDPFAVGLAALVLCFLR